jgi:hypothetical protein
MAERVAVREISNEEDRKLLSIVRRGSGSVVRWRRAQIVLWSAQHMDVPAIAKIAPWPRWCPFERGFRFTPPQSFKIAPGLIGCPRA